MKWIAALSSICLSIWLSASCGSENPYRQGEILYHNFCANCHMENGQGLGQLIPPIAQSDYLKEHQGELACMIRHGMNGEIVVNGKSYNQAMPGVAQLNDVEITNIINFINVSWGNELAVVQLQQIQQQLEKCR